MRIARSNRFFLNPNQKKTLSEMMLKDLDDNGASVEPEMEEGEISDDSEAVESNLENDPKPEDSSISDSKTNSNLKPRVESRVTGTHQWMFHVPSGHYSHLHNFAWARAVQNKPLNEFIFDDFGSDRNESKPPRLMSKIVAANSEEGSFCNGRVDEYGENEIQKVDINSKAEDMEVVDKEEGELEEGEIELSLGLDLEIVDKSQESLKESKEKSLEKELNLILEKLKTITTSNDPMCFVDVCFRLREFLQGLKLVGLEASEDLIQLFYSGIQSAYAVYCSTNLKQQEQSKEAWLRLLDHISKKEQALFSRKQVKEFEAMMEYQVSNTGFARIDANDKGRVAFQNSQIDRISRPLADTSSIKPANGDRKSNSEVYRLERHGNASARGFVPLVSLQCDQDADSLPSPTRENPPPSIQNLPAVEVRVIGSGPAVGFPHGAAEDTSIHPFETDVLKAVSSYQEKFGRTSFFSSNRLPSPTPSEECDDGGTDIGGEVSSFSVNKRQAEISGTNLLGLDKPPSSTADGIRTQNSHNSVSSFFDLASNGGVVVPSFAGQLTAGSNAPAKPQPKSRDPRLRHGNPLMGAFHFNKQPPPVNPVMPKDETLSGIMNPRKQKVIEEAVLDGHRLKRQRNGLTDPGLLRDSQMFSGSFGLVEEGASGPQDPRKRIMVGSENGKDISFNKTIPIDSTATMGANSNEIKAGSEQLPSSGISAAVSLPTLLKEIAENPTLLMSLLKMEQQRLAAESQQKSADSSQFITPTSSMLPATIPSGKFGSLVSSELEQKPAIQPPMPAQTTPMNFQNDLGKVRMKPRDPRRILHNNIGQKSETVGSEQAKSNGAVPLNVQGLKDHLTVRELGLQAEASCSSLQSSSSPPDIASQFTKKLKNIADLITNSQSPTISQAIPSNMDRDEENKTDSSLVQNPWGDVDHLLEGYDDQQKAIIQKERARRIEEQNKMFASRKLCLVLDLDHTLLNSAKFIEVDPQHEEILRRKEEQDREKPKRHLFRFAHMGMWTKLRPGIWTFLEKASELFELHLYTMGNKLYATEMAKVLDPTGVLFNGRVISKGDEGDPFDADDRVPRSKDLDGVLGMESAVVIIDDSVRVWPHHRHNLIVVERYTYFPCSRRQFGLPGPSLLEIDHDERPEDGTLASSLAVIGRIHRNFFSSGSLNSIDVRDILASEQQRILSGCRIIFSRVFPVGEANPHLHPLWQTAEQFGAVCTNQLDDQVTHVVAISLGTDKVNWALSTGRFVVYPGWLEASALLYHRANERDFAIIKP